MLLYGEDHLFVWRALQEGIPVKSTGSVMFTSARKYSRNGWYKITSLHLYLWLKQAFPQFVILLRKRFFMKCAIAVFAKTPGLSPVKTRLAAGVGKADAEEFYRLSISAVTEIVTAACEQSNGRLVPYWALAEEEAIDLPVWGAFRSLWTGDGGLGQRLAQVFNRLFEDHDMVLLMGTDSPQLSPDVILNACNLAEAKPGKCIIGPANDGGFYLFATTHPVESDIWTTVSYSVDTTFSQLSELLECHGSEVVQLESRIDVDDLQSLEILEDELRGRSSILLSAQKQLLNWLEEYFCKKTH